MALSDGRGVFLILIIAPSWVQKAGHYFKCDNHMERIIKICEIAGFKITETRRFEAGKLVKSVFHIRTHSGKIVSRGYSNPVEPSKLLARIRNKISQP